MNPLVSVGQGSLRGAERDGAWLFAGIPYAAAPVGPLRWRPPQPPLPWSGVRDATAFGSIAPQPPPARGMGIPAEAEHQDEDCLSLNVWTPGIDGRRRPVMVWVHGGSFTTGTGSNLLYGGAPLALGQDVVVVTINYRLGALGFLGHPALATDLPPEGPVGPPDRGAGPRVGGAGASRRISGNWGLLDQLAALRWVRANIEAFGGDPSNVTLFGESAGAMSIGALLAAPAARGLFHRAILESGPPYTHTKERAATVAQSLVRALGLAEVDRDALERVPAADLVSATQVVERELAELNDIPVVTLPVVDGGFLLQAPELAVAQGAAAPVPLLIGTNRDELSFFGVGRPRFALIDEAGLAEWLAAVAPEGPPDLVERYRQVRSARGLPTKPYDLWVAIGTDLVFRLPSLRLAAGHRAHQPGTFVYLFTQPSPVLDGVLGACHALDVPFVFGAVDHPVVEPFVGSGGEVHALSERMQRMWADFARHGHPTPEDPSGWPAWDEDRRATMVLGPYGEAPAGGVVDAPDDDTIAAWGPLVGDHLGDSAPLPVRRRGHKGGT